MIRWTALVIAVSLASAGWTGPPVATARADEQIKLQVKHTQDVGTDYPVCAAVEIPAALKSADPEKLGVTLKCQTCGAGPVPGQIVVRDGKAELWWIMPKSKADGTGTWVATLSATPYAGKDVFTLKDTEGKHLDVLFAGRPVTRYMYERDTSTKQRAHETYKVYHHVFDEEGKEFITKGPGGRYTHHRGIFIGWSRLSAGGKRYDTWHMKNATQEHQKFLAKSAGPVLARTVALVHWIGGGKDLLCAEERETIIFRQPAPTLMLMEFRSRLKAVSGALELGGDPEHAGMQYRPHNNVAQRPKDAKKPDDGSGLATIYEFHKDGIKTKGQSLKENKDLPWAAMSYALFGKRYAVEHMNYKSNPTGTRYSAYRSYGRFGAFPVAKVPEGETLALRYRIHVMSGGIPSREVLSARHAAFNTPPEVKVVP